MINRSSGSFAVSEVEYGEDFESYREDDDGGSAYYRDRGVSLDGNVYVELVYSDAIKELKTIVDRMIQSGYEKECCQVYSNVRRDVLDECLSILGVEKLSIEEVQSIEWKILEEKMKKWIQAVKVVVKVLLFGEKRSCGQVFGVFSYFAFGENTRDIVAANMGKGVLSSLVQ
ncbi:putative exocyst complex component Exo70, cullin repeat-like-containing domain superfamily [Helianthus annuus]|nr:putative exocyst complex component Exo70, cullin repeat-like-containing domain superfamily [Helianthus annuus]KAJ0894317.1 putative exocyst complex component Exo70, cullin repeat-like-containing domain superfamily [Helianthus annuus]